MDMSLSNLWMMVMDREAWSATVHGSQRVGHNWAVELNHNKWVQKEKILLSFTQRFDRVCDKYKDKIWDIK